MNYTQYSRQDCSSSDPSGQSRSPSQTHALEMHHWCGEISSSQRNRPSGHRSLSTSGPPYPWSGWTGKNKQQRHVNTRRSPKSSSSSSPSLSSSMSISPCVHACRYGWDSKTVNPYRHTPMVYMSFRAKFCAGCPSWCNPVFTFWRKTGTPVFGGAYSLWCRHQLARQWEQWLPIRALRLLSLKL